MKQSKTSSVVSVPSVVIVQAAGESLELHADRAVYWNRTATLIIADPHFGKAAAFRAGGIAVPAGTTQHNLQRLTHLICTTGAKRLMVLGDFFHAAAGRAEQTLRSIECWRREFEQLEVLLIRGNHDQHAGDPPCEWNFCCVDEPYLQGKFAFRHTPVENANPFTFAGHIHPCVILHDRIGASMRSACFHLAPHQLILPAFGAFTGAHPIVPRRGERIFAVGDGAIIETRMRS